MAVFNNILEKFKVPRQSEKQFGTANYFVLKVNSNQLRTKRKRVKPNEMKLTIYFFFNKLKKRVKTNLIWNHIMCNWLVFVLWNCWWQFVLGRERFDKCEWLIMSWLGGILKWYKANFFFRQFCWDIWQSKSSFWVEFSM